MNATMAIWGLVLLIVFAAAQYATPSYLAVEHMWVVLAIIIVALNAWVGKRMKADEAGRGTWLSLAVFGFIVTVIVAFGVVPLDVSWLMSLWLLLIGAGILAGGIAGKFSPHIFGGFVMLFAALFVPAFGAQYFMAGAIFLGLFGLISGIFSPNQYIPSFFLFS